MTEQNRSLREEVLATGVVAKVKVNQRHLIDKILARYSGEFTIFRELIQNANDAGANNLEIHLKSNNFPKESSLEVTNTENPRRNFSSSTAAAASLLALFNITKVAPQSKKNAEKLENNAPSWYENCMISEILVKNNGRLFEDGDWNRVRRIAEGNPNQQACGMFGVGFYSVFSISENPMIRSGDTVLLFHWNEDQLLTSQLQLEKKNRNNLEENKWVSIILETRDEISFNLENLCQFLVRSVVFTNHVKTLKLFINQYVIFQITLDRSFSDPFSSKTNVPNSFMIPESLQFQTLNVEISKYKTSGSLFLQSNDNVINLNSNNISVNSNSNSSISINNNVDINNEGISKINMKSEKITMNQITSRVRINWDINIEFQNNMKRILKKDPPSTTYITFLINSQKPRSEFDSKKPNPLIPEKHVKKGFGSFFSSIVDKFTVVAPGDGTQDLETSPVFYLLQDLYPTPSKGRVFIGFPTQQTTGSGYHLQSQLIPTMERENIDFSDVYLANWNCNILAVSGSICRAYYDDHIILLHRKKLQVTMELGFLAVGNDLITQLFKSFSSHHVFTIDDLQLLSSQLKSLNSNIIINASNSSGNNNISSGSLNNNIQSKSRSLQNELNQLNYQIFELINANYFTRSSPSEKVSALISNYFFLKIEELLVPTEVNTSLLHLPDTKLVCLTPLKKARLPNFGLEKILPHCAIVDPLILQNCKQFIQMLVNIAKLTEVSFEDLLDYLYSKVLSTEELIQILSWYSIPEVHSQIFKVPLRQNSNNNLSTNNNNSNINNQNNVHASNSSNNLASDSNNNDNSRNNPLISKFLNALVVDISNGGINSDNNDDGNQIIRFGSITTYAGKNMENLPLPPTTLPHSLALRIHKPIMQKHFLWNELTCYGLYVYYRNVKYQSLFTTQVDNNSINNINNNQGKQNVRDIIFVLQFVYDHFSSFNKDQLSIIKHDLSQIRCIMTADASSNMNSDHINTPSLKANSEPKIEAPEMINDVSSSPSPLSSSAFRKPGEVYFPEVSLFSDMVKVHPQYLKLFSRKFLSFLGVLDRPDLALVFSRLGELNWNIRDLILFFIKEQGSFTPSDWNILQTTPFLPTLQYLIVPKVLINQPHDEHHSPSEEGDRSNNGVHEMVEFRSLPHQEFSKKIFIPDRENVTLGLPVIDWKGAWKENAEVVTFLTKIGVSKAPKLSLLCKIASLNEVALRNYISLRDDDASLIAPFLQKLSNFISYKALCYIQLKFSSLSADLESISRIPFIPTVSQPLLDNNNNNNSSSSNNSSDSDNHNAKLLLSPNLQFTNNEELHAILEEMRNRKRVTECYLNESPYDSTVVCPRWKTLAKLFGVAEYPPLERIISLLQKSPPNTYNQTKLLFDYFYSRIAEFSSTNWALLHSLNFIPVFSDGEQHQHQHQQQQQQQQQQQRVFNFYANVRQVLLKSDNNLKVFKNLFDYIDFGEKANMFLKNCGVSEHPTPQQFIDAIITNHQRFIQANGSNDYLVLIHYLSHLYSSGSISSDKSLISKLKSNNWCIAYQEASSPSSPSPSSSQPSSSSSSPPPASEHRNGMNQMDDHVVIICKPSECFLIDDEKVKKLFSVVFAPQDELIEQLYERLGSAWLSSCITTKFKISGIQRQSDLATFIQGVIRQRKEFFLHDMTGRKRKDIVENAEQILEHLEVFYIDEIAKELTLSPLKRVKFDITSVGIATSRSSSSDHHHHHHHHSKDMKNERPPNYQMFISVESQSDVDYYDIAYELMKIIYITKSSSSSSQNRNYHQPLLNYNAKINQQKEVLQLAMLLREPLHTLRNKGWAVDRILHTNIPSVTIPKFSLSNNNNSDHNAGNVFTSKTAPKDTSPPLSAIHQMSSAKPSDDLKSILDSYNNNNNNNNSGNNTKHSPEILSGSNATSTNNSSNNNNKGLASSPSGGSGSGSGGSGNTKGSLSPSKPAANSFKKFWANIGNGMKMVSNPFIPISKDDITDSNNNTNVNNNNNTPITQNAGNNNVNNNNNVNQTTNNNNNNNGKLQSEENKDDTVITSSVTLDHTKPLSENSYARRMLTQIKDAVNVSTSSQSAEIIQTHAKKETHIHYSCNILSDQLMTKFMILDNKIAFYLEEGAGFGIAENHQQLIDFSNLIFKLASSVFLVPITSVNIFFDKNSNRVAFNRSSSLYFNLRFHIGLLKSNELKNNEAVYFWYMIFCHELAHNLFSNHGEEHTSLLQWISVSHFPKFSIAFET